MFVITLHLEHPLSSTSLYLEQFSRSLSIDSSLIFSLYLELSLSRTNSLVPCEFEIERVHCDTFSLFVCITQNYIIESLFCGVKINYSVLSSKRHLCIIYSDTED